MATVMQKATDKIAKDVICDFLTVAIHNLLFCRNVYPAGAFKLRQKFNVPLHVCYHPEVFAYITDIIQSIAELLKNGKLHAVHVVIGTTACDWETITFKIHALSPCTNQDQLNDMERGLKSCLLKLSIVDSMLQRRHSEQITWRVEIDAAESDMELNHSWLPSDASSNYHQQIIPLKKLSAECVTMEIFVITQN